jgi:hypothetical protein
MDGLFSQWLRKDEPKGLEGAKRRILGEEDMSDALRRQRAQRAEKQASDGIDNFRQQLKVPGKIAKAYDKQVDDAIALPNPGEKPKPESRDFSRTTLLQPESKPGRIPGHELGSSAKTAADLNNIIDERSKLREKYEADMKAIDLNESNVNEEAASRRKIIDSLVQSIGSGTTMEQLRDRFIALAARAATQPRKVRAGKGARSITSDDRDAILNEDNIKRLVDGYGDGSWEQMKTFGDSMKMFKSAMEDSEWDDVAKRWYGHQSSDIQKVFQSAGDLGAKDGGSRMHFNGFDENGQKIAGRANSPLRTLALAKVFLQQGGLDGYTGLPLEFDHMEPDHIRGFSQKVNGRTPGAADRMMADHPDNWIWTSTGINNIKSNDALPDFIEKLKNMSPKKLEKLMSGSTLNLQDEGQRYLADDTTDFARSFITQYEDDEGPVNILSDTLTQSIIDQRQGYQDTMIQSLQDAGAQVDQSRLLTDIFAAGGVVPKQHRLNLPSQNKEDIRERSQARLGDNAQREMYRLMVGQPPERQAQISRAWTSSWKEAIQIIRDQFALYDNGENFTNQDLVLGDEDPETGLSPMKGGPTLRKLFGMLIAQKLGADGEAIQKRISVNEMFDVITLGDLL